jgi:hypothetical protein
MAATMGWTADPSYEYRIIRDCNIDGMDYHPDDHPGLQACDLLPWTSSLRQDSARLKLLLDHHYLEIAGCLRFVGPLEHT